MFARAPSVIADKTAMPAPSRREPFVNAYPPHAVGVAISVRFREDNILPYGVVPSICPLNAKTDTRRRLFCVYLRLKELMSKGAELLLLFFLGLLIFLCAVGA